MSKNLVLGSSFGYPVEKITPFILSLRQHYQDDICMIIDVLTPELEKFFEENLVYSFIPSEPIVRQTCQVKRYEFYKECVEEHFTDSKNILIADVRDLVFQADPFISYPQHSLEFFAEPETFKNCTHNSPWVAGIYGRDRVEQITDEYVICSGTTMGTRDGIIEYFSAMISEIDRLNKDFRQLSGGEDQPVHNHLVYNSIFKDFGINHNSDGPICTMHHSQTLTFNRAGQLLNDNGEIIPVVHQYDRCGPMSLVFLKNALGNTGKKGIMTAANYAVNNFQEHDLG